MKEPARYWDKFAKFFSPKETYGKSTPFGYKEFFENKNCFKEIEEKLEHVSFTDYQEKYLKDALLKFGTTAKVTHTTARMSDLIPSGRLPKQFMDRVPQNLNSRFMGIRLADMTREELIAALVQACHGSLV